MPRPITTPALFGAAVNAVASSSRLRLRPNAHAYIPLASSRPFSTSRARRDAAKERPPPEEAVPGHDELVEEQKRIYAQFRPVIDAFDAPIDMAVAYGSGVVKQANKSGPPPLTDFIIATPSTRTFHAINLKQHPSHYPLYARLIGPSALAWMTDNLGAGLWYVTMVKFGDMKVKYGILSTPTLTRDLQHWETLYVAGRLHKPVLTLASLALALLQLPGTFTELALWEKIAGISYSGDPRMSVPGAENPEKVRNIVRGPGVLGAFRELYAPHVGSVGLRWAGEPQRAAGQGVGGEKGAVVEEHGEKGGPALGTLGGGHEGGVICAHDGASLGQATAEDTPAHTWHGDGAALLTQPTTPEHAGALLASLPLRVRQRLAAHFRPTVAAALISPEVAAERRDVRERRRAAAAAKESRALYDDDEFWRRVAGQPGFVEVVNNEVRHIIKRPALTQSVKGLITAGFSKSVVYSFAKFRKWLAGRKK